MNTELIEAIDEAIEQLEEDVTKNQESTLLGIINSLDDNKYSSIEDFKKSPWNKLDNKWDKVAKEIKNTQVDSNMTNMVIKVTGAKQRNELNSENFDPVPESDCYVSFDTYSKTAQLTTIDKASAVDGGFFENKALRKQVGDWLKKDSIENNPNGKYDFSDIKTSVEKIKINKVKKDKQLNYNILAEFYFNLYNENKWPQVPEYWKRAIANDLTQNQSLIANDPLMLMDKALILKFDGKDLIEILQDDKVSQLIYFVLIKQHSVNISTLNDEFLTDNFIIAAILSKCFNDLSEKDAAALLEQFTKIRQYYGSMQTRVQNIIDGSNDDEKSQVLAEHAILVSKDQGLAQNPFIIYSENPEVYEANDTKIKAIEVEELIHYRGVSQKELQRILTIIMDPNKQSASNWYLVINDTPYLLEQKSNKLKLMKKENIKFYGKASIKIVFSTERNIDNANDKINFKTINDDTFVLKDPKDDTIKAEDYFEIKNGYLYVKADKGFITNNFNADVIGAGRDQKISKITITDSINPLTEKDPGNPDKGKKDKEPKNDETNTTDNKPEDTSNSKITEDQARDAIKKYLYKQDLAIFKGKGKQNKIDDFIDRRTFNGVSLSDRYKSLINSVIKEIQKDPKLYKYNTELNQIEFVDGSSMLDVLIDVLNGNMADAIAAKEANEIGQNIPGIKVDKTNIKAPDVSAKTIADKLDNISTILKQDTTEGTDKTSKDVINKISKGDLAEIISWFNDRYSNKKKVSVDSTANKDNS